MSPFPEPPRAIEPFDPQPEPSTLSWLEAHWPSHGDCFAIPAARRRHDSVFVNDARAVNHVLKTNHRNYVKGAGFERVEMLLGNGIITSDGDQWRRQRTMIQPAFKTGRVASLHQVMLVAAGRLADRWNELADGGDGATGVNLTREMSEFGLEVILRALFSEDYESMAGAQTGHQFAFLATEFERDLRFAHRFRKLTAPVGALIDQRLETGRRPDDLLSGLLDATHRASGEGMSRRELIDEVTTLIVAGHETSAGTLNWAIYELARHPDVCGRVVEELMQLPGTGPADLLGLRFTRQVLDETLRLYPPVWLFSRRALASDQVLDLPIAAGTNVFLSPYLLHRNDRYWPDPARFDPDRFSEPPAVPGSFIPFSAGSRRCIGEHFSYLEMLTLLAAVLPRFSLRLTAAEPVAIDAAINLRSARDIVMTLTHRMPS